MRYCFSSKNDVKEMKRKQTNIDSLVEQHTGVKDKKIFEPSNARLSARVLTNSILFFAVCLVIAYPYIQEYIFFHQSQEIQEVIDRRNASIKEYTKQKLRYDSIRKVLNEQLYERK